MVQDTIEARLPSGERVVLHLPSGTYLKLDESAGAIVDLLVKYDDGARAAAALALDFSILLDQARTDVATVIDAIGGLEPSRASHGRYPTARGAMQVLQEWWSLPVEHRVVAAKVAVMVVVVEAGLRTMDIDRLTRLVGVPLEAGVTLDSEIHRQNESTLSPAEKRTYWATGWVLNRWVFPATCLRRALVIGFFLRKHHPVLRLGLVKGGTTAHAWVEAKGLSLDATEVTASFAAAGAARP